MFTRHRAIAETTIQLLEEEMFYGIDPDDIYTDLVVAAQTIKMRGDFVPNLEKWRYLSDHFMDKGNFSLAIHLTQGLLELERTDSFQRVKLAQQFRKAGQPQQAVKAFRSAPIISELRGFFSEWGTSERTEGNYALSVYLIGYALADESVQKLPTNDDAIICLNGLCVACELFFKTYNNVLFIEGVGSAAQLGLSLGVLLGSNDKLTFSKYKKVAKDHGIESVSNFAALKRIQETITYAYKKREAELPNWIRKPEDLHFQGLRDLLHIRVLS